MKKTSVSLKSLLRLLLIVFIAGLLNGCVYWRLYQTMRQLNEFDQYFSVIIKEDFTWHFKYPLVYSDDFNYLSKFKPTSVHALTEGQRWRYLFYKVDDQKQRSYPPVKYYFDLSFNQQQLLTDWSLSALFLNIAPAEFLEVSLRSIGKANISQSKRQLKVDVASMQKTKALLPKKNTILAQLGEPLTINQEEKLEIFTYHFLLDTPEIEEGYEDRALTTAKLAFDENDNLVKVAGRFVGIKLRIDYRKYMEKKQDKII
jgi:hypothetical protein